MSTWMDIQSLRIPEGISSTGKALGKPEIKPIKGGKSYQVLLSQEMIALCKDIGSRRQGIKDQHGIQGSEYAKPDDDPARFHQRGVANEIAVAALLGVQPDLRVFAHGTKGINLRFGEHIRISIKHNSRSWGDLRFEPGKVPNVDYIIMTTGDFEQGEVHIVGWVSRDQYLAQAEIRDLPGQGERLLLPQHQLAPMDHLLYELGLKEKLPEQAQLDLFS